MTQIMLEHVNITVPNPHKTAKMLGDLFGWRIRWEGAGMMGGYTVHCGDDAQYIALYAPEDSSTAGDARYSGSGNLNHIGIVVADLEAIETKVKALGFTPVNHGDYEPGRRFYFVDGESVEYEIIAYD